MTCTSRLRMPVTCINIVAIKVKLSHSAFCVCETSDSWVNSEMVPATHTPPKRKFLQTKFYDWAAIYPSGCTRILTKMWARLKIISSYMVPL